MSGPSERDEIAAVPRCPGCGSVVDPTRHTCYPLTVDVTKPGYRYLEGVWGYCLTLSRDVRIGEDWLAERDRRVAAAAVESAADDEEFEATCDHLPWVRLGGHCQCGYLRGLAADIRDRADRIEADR